MHVMLQRGYWQCDHFTLSPYAPSTCTASPNQKCAARQQPDLDARPPSTRCRWDRRPAKERRRAVCTSSSSHAAPTTLGQRTNGGLRVTELIARVLGIPQPVCSAYRRTTLELCSPRQPPQRVRCPNSLGIRKANPAHDSCRSLVGWAHRGWALGAVPAAAAEVPMA